MKPKKGKLTRVGYVDFTDVKSVKAGTEKLKKRKAAYQKKNASSNVRTFIKSTRSL